MPHHSTFEATESPLAFLSQTDELPVAMYAEHRPSLKFLLLPGTKYHSASCTTTVIRDAPEFKVVIGYILLFVVEIVYEYYVLEAPGI